MQLNEQTLQRIAMTVCQTMLGLELIPVERELQQPDPMFASIQIHGRQLITVDLCAAKSLAQVMAAAMFYSDRSRLTDDDVCDAFGEVTNMIGGNIKALFGEEAQLSLPAIKPSCDFVAVQFRNSLRATFECCSHQLTILVRERLTNSIANDAMAVHCTFS